MQRTSTRLLRSDSDPFGQLRSDLDTWRQGRKRGERIPEPLWKAAAGLAQTHGVGRVCVALKLNYYDLHRRLGGTRRSRNPRPSSPTFVALPAPVPIDPGTFELIHTNGSRLSLRLPNPKPRDLLPLVQAFLRS
jgi:hypothetical protein